MIVTRWKMPVVVNDEGIRFSIGSPEEAINWLRHELDGQGHASHGALEACEAACAGKVPVEHARYAVERAARNRFH
jgi:hypothetical protein